MSANLATWAWIPITIWAAFAQTLRNAAQRHLTSALGTLGATLVRFLYGLPFAALWLAVVTEMTGVAAPALSVSSLLWGALGALAQLVATALLLRAMEERNFTLAVAWSKTEIVQVAVFALALLGDPLTLGLAASVVLGTVGVMLSSAKGGGWRSLLSGWTSRAALIGLASGAAFAVSTVGYRGAALALLPTPALIAAATVLLYAQTLQTVLLGGWLLARDRAVIAAVFREWRASGVAGFMGAAASAGWFTAMAMEPVANVRTVGLVELIFSYAVSLRLFKERLSGLERAGLVLVVLGMLGILNLR
ncbi:MAG TPA: DMT family transporter [Stellaceae bacterium]|nr:DMT family transporter [Stellaceae bacterium]